MHPTRHAKKRIKRLGRGKSALKDANLAIQNGIRRVETRGELRRYLDKHQFKYGSGSLIVFHNFLWVFDDNERSLITCYPLPGKIVQSRAFKKMLERLTRNK